MAEAALVEVGLHGAVTGRAVRHRQLLADDGAQRQDVVRLADAGDVDEGDRTPQPASRAVAVQLDGTGVHVQPPGQGEGERGVAVTRLAGDEQSLAAADGEARGLEQRDRPGVDPDADRP
jgi:hypothetical protein